MHILKNQVPIKQLPTKDIEGKFNFFLIFKFIFRAVPVAYGRSQGRG